MKSVIVSLVLALPIHYALGLKNLDKPRWKSFGDAQQECAEYLLISEDTIDRYISSGYPDESSVQTHIYCILINLNSWNQTTLQINDYVFNRFFRTLPGDCIYKQRTEQCLAQQNLYSKFNVSIISRAYNSFMCYYQYYGILSNEPQWVPFRVSEIHQVLVDSLRIIPHHRKRLLQYCQGFMLVPPEFPDLMYAFTVRLAFYNESTGFDLQKLYAQFGMKEILTEKTSDCIGRVTNKYCVEPARVVNTMQTCFSRLYLSLRKMVSSAASLVLGHPAECLIGPRFDLKTY
ncbi:uncharacterized protein LOC135700921 [Ochlerotatus camptorhynchus]|uniref:uncharacterized protein LOC135700921 n=1 Tax=Ochlerotatus camptorhynchus TaxID=644619 RepID=UPI0031E46590